MTEIRGVHPYADKFPMLPDAELDELAESIRSVGLLHPVVVTPDGLILDGRNRLEACNRAEVEASTEVYDGTDLAEYVIACNVTRRNMSTGARAMAVALVLAEDGQRADGKWQNNQGGRGKKADGIPSGLNRNTWREALSQAGIVLDYAPALAREVVDGHLAIDNAYRKACDTRDAERAKLAEQERLAAEEADARAFIEQEAPDLAAQVGDTFESFLEARDIWERRNREEAARIKAEKAAKKKQAEEDRRARVDTYSRICKALCTLESHGLHHDADLVMADYRGPAELDPPELAKWLDPENLTTARDFIDRLIIWAKEQQ